MNYIDYPVNMRSRCNFPNSYNGFVVSEIAPRADHINENTSLWQLASFFQVTFECCEMKICQGFTRSFLTATKLHFYYYFVNRLGKSLTVKLFSKDFTYLNLENKCL